MFNQENAMTSAPSNTCEEYLALSRNQRTQIVKGLVVVQVTSGSIAADIALDDLAARGRRSGVDAETIRALIFAIDSGCAEALKSRAQDASLASVFRGAFDNRRGPTDVIR